MKNGFEKINIGIHPRAFAALGADLVTNDVVAVIELVKNSYDAFAPSVWVRFGNDPKDGPYIEIEDTGQGMTKEIIEGVWCLVATPYKDLNPFVKNGNKKRRVSGEKGLGRLSAARLGSHLRMLTQAVGQPCWEVHVDWDDISKKEEIAACFASFRLYPEKSIFKSSGTRIQIFGLKANWDEAKVNDLEANLGRLISPFLAAEVFNIYLSRLGSDNHQEVKIEAPSFLTKPKYLIAGKVDNKGNIDANYTYSPIDEGKPRKGPVECSWKKVYESIQTPYKFPFSPVKATCGSFSFEIRAWDISTDDTEEIAKRFNFQKSKVREAIHAHKGISVYRDDILVLPKSDNTRDWLGLDLRRISKVGTRLSTSQIVGYVAISAEINPDIDDTSDRERLDQNLAVAEFEELLKVIVALFESERSIDRIKIEREMPLKDLFGRLSADQLVSDITAMAQEGADISEAVDAVRSYGVKLDAAREDVQERFIYYSRLASVGSIAQMLVHEIRNRTTAVGGFMKYVWDKFNPFNDKSLTDRYEIAKDSVGSLERLADVFAPLASRAFKRGRRHSIIEDCINACLNLEKGTIEKYEIEYNVPKGSTPVAIDPGELDAILLNLISNAIYWLSEVKDKKRKINFQIEKIDNGNRVKVWVHDNGPGIKEEDREKVFWAGFTRKLGGIGMGLTVASELVAEHDGKMFLAKGVLGGASFGFDIPVKKG